MQTTLGLAYLMGDGVVRDFAEGERRLTAADTPWAHYWLGRMRSGDGPYPFDSVVAKSHLEKAVEGQVGAAAALLARMYQDGRLPSADPAEMAALWFQFGVDCFCIECAFEAGRIRADQGRWREAYVLWLWAAAEDRNYQAMEALADAILVGDLPAENPKVAALGWLVAYRLAGYGDGRAEALEQDMSAAEVAEGETWGQEFFATYFGDERLRYRVRRVLQSSGG